MLDTSFLEKILVDLSYISSDDRDAGRAYEKAGKGTFLDYLFGEGIINRTTLGLAIAESYDTVFTDLDARAPSHEDLLKFPEALAKKFHALFIKEDTKTVTLATDSFPGKELQAAAQVQFPKKKIVLTYAFPESIDQELSHYQKELNTRFGEIITHDKRIAPELFEEIIKDALSYRASDIHFEPQTEVTLIRFRIDGMLRFAGSISRDFYESVLNRIKIQSNLRTDEHFAPQDGAIRFIQNGNPVDLRVSVVPLLDGEKVVIRVLTEYVHGLSFVDLGLSERHIAQFEAASKKPFGMILVSGPTGSGKTTTLYSLLKKLNTPEVNITTIEDPVEYRMQGTNQIQVNQKTDLTFAKGLRAVVRQDPNIILVGEIRDRETAETAINAALTGHLLLSTFHANNAAASVPRLLDMEVEPFLLASTVELLIGQRLVRRVCESCRVSYTEKSVNLKSRVPEAAKFFTNTTTTLFKGTGCAACTFTGYHGRTALIEIIEVTPAIKTLIGKRPSAEEVWRVAEGEGAQSMFEDGIEKAKRGLTTIEEVLRVATPPDQH